MMLVRELKSRRREFAVTASTGVAAVTVGGHTINSWAGIGLGEGTADELYKRMNGRAKKRIREVEILILDEISMISAKLFSTLDEVFQLGRPQHKSKPFGGVQLIISGDFLQLPPFEKTVHVQSLSAAGAADAIARAKRVKFAFESGVWQSVIPRERVIELSTVHRQKGDDMLVRYVIMDCAALCLVSRSLSDSHGVVCAALQRSILTEIRSGKCSRATELRIQQTVHTEFGSIKPVKLTTHRLQAEEINQQELDSLPGKPIQFDAIDSGLYDSEKEACQAPTTLLLKIG
jgi:ATP-dependent DNA helicase PIF1